MTKKELRIKVKTLKAAQDKRTWSDRSEEIFDFVEVLESFSNAKKILAFWSLDDEINTHAFVQKWASTKEVYLPVVKGDNLELVRFEGVEKMKPEPIFGILEPSSSQLASPSEIDLIIVPGLAFDYKCNRLGRGKGYYDRLLKETAAVKVGVGFDFQLFAEVPVESYDVALDMIVTESECIAR